MKKIVLVILSFIVFLIFSLPHIVGLIKYGKSYRIFQINKSDSISIEETYTYAPRVMELKTKNQFFIKDPYVFENRFKPSPFLGETLPAHIMLFLSNISGSIQNGFILGNSIFPVLIFLTIFLFIYKLQKNFLSTLAASSTALFLRDIFLVLPYPSKVFEYLANNKYTEFLPFSRSFHPQLSFFILLLFIVSLYFVLLKKTKAMAAVCMISLGLLFYTYVFYWTTAIFTLFILGMYFLYKKNKRMLILFVCLSLGGLIIGSLYFYNMYLFQQLAQSKSFLEKSSYLRSGLVFTPSFRFLIFSVIIVFFKKIKTKADILFLVIIIAASLAPSLAITYLGRDLEGIHWVRRLILPVFSMYFFFLLSSYKTKIAKYFCLAAIIIAFSYGFFVQLKATNMFISERKANMQDEELWQYLNNKMPKGQVIGSVDVDKNLSIAALSPHYVYLPMSNMTLSPPNEILERYFVLSAYLGKNKKETIDYLNKNLGFFIYYFLWEDRGGLNHKKLEKEIDLSFQKFNFDKSKVKYQLDYFLLKREDEIANNSKLGKLVFNNKKYLLYKTK